MTTPAPVTILSDPLLNDFGPARPSLLVGEALARHRPVTLVALRMGEAVKRRLVSLGIEVRDLDAPEPPGSQSVGYLLDWLGTALRPGPVPVRGRPDSIVLNFSNTLIAPATAWFAQGTITETLRGIMPALDVHHKLAAKFALPLVAKMEDHLLRRFASRSGVVVANSSYDRELYLVRGCPVDGIIPPPIDSRLFHPATGQPTSDYVLTYVGKETDWVALYQIAKAGLPLKVFGSKVDNAWSRLRSLPNVELLGRVEDAELVRLYSNAAFTLFPFTIEPFGYVPVESMACGTPVLTYAWQGPGESVLDGKTGRLARSSQELTTLAQELWRSGWTTPGIRKDCVERAASYDLERIGRRWENLLESPASRGAWSVPSALDARAARPDSPTKGPIATRTPGSG